MRPRVSLLGAVIFSITALTAVFSVATVGAAVNRDSTYTVADVSFPVARPSSYKYEGRVAGVTTSDASTLSFSSVTPASTTLTIDGSSTPYGSVIMNNGSVAATNVAVQGWIQQGQTKRAGGGSLVSCNNGALGIVPAGTCVWGGFSIAAMDTATISGTGSFVPGAATAIFELKVNEVVVNTFNIPVTLVANTTAVLPPTNVVLQRTNGTSASFVNFYWVYPNQTQIRGMQIYRSTTAGTKGDLRVEVSITDVTGTNLTGRQGTWQDAPLDLTTDYYYTLCTVTATGASACDTQRPALAQTNLSTATITVVAPQGPQTWQVGQTYNIQWALANAPSDDKLEVIISLYAPGSDGSVGEADVAANQLTYAYTVPASVPARSGYELRLQTCYAQSDGSNACLAPQNPYPAYTQAQGTITVVSATTAQPTITVSYPNGGEQLTIGQNYNVSWRTSGTLPNEVLGVYLALQKPGDQTFVPGAGGVLLGAGGLAVTGGTYIWQAGNYVASGSTVVTAPPGDGYKIVATLWSYTESKIIAQDSSDASFSLLPVPGTQPSTTPLTPVLCSQANLTGVNQFVGCVWKWRDTTNDPTAADDGIAEGDAPLGPKLTSPVPGTATALDFNSPLPDFPKPQIQINSLAGAEYYSARWLGSFTFAPGTYHFVGGADDGIRVQVNGETKIDQWRRGDYHEGRFDITVPTQEVLTFDIDYYQHIWAAQVRFGWTTQSATSTTQTPLVTPTPTPTPLPPTPIDLSAPIMIAPKDGDTITAGDSYNFSVQPVTGANGYLFGFFQNGTMVYENWRDDHRLSYDGTWYIQSGSKGYAAITNGDLQVWVRALMGGQWTDARVITVHITGASSSNQTTTTEPPTSSTVLPDAQVVGFQTTAQKLTNGNDDDVLNQLQVLRDRVKELETENKYLKSLLSGTTAPSDDTQNTLRDFITYGVDPNTQALGAGERAAVLNSYKAAFDKLPTTQDEISDTIKIANGRWPTERSQAAEDEAKKNFEKVYGREPDMNNPHDNAAITIMAYGLRQSATNRNLKSEAAGIEIFAKIFGHAPATTEEWNVMQAITYSGATQ